MRTYSIYDAKTHFSRLIKEALSGEKIVISNRGLPLVEVIPIPKLKRQKRKLGTMKGSWHISDDFDQPLEEFDEYL